MFGHLWKKYLYKIKYFVWYLYRKIPGTLKIEFYFQKNIIVGGHAIFMWNRLSFRDKEGVEWIYEIMSIAKIKFLAASIVWF